jgi:predicted nucleic acid-binding protein
MIILDTDIVIDLLRKFPPALAWLASLGATELALPGYVAMELVQGCRNKAEQDQLMKTLNRFRTIWPSEQACQAALNDFVAYRLSHHVGLLDTLIAHTVIELPGILHTFNQKHYAPLTALVTVQPYKKTPV